MISYNPLYNKYPVGAVPTETEVVLSFSVCDKRVTNATLILRDISSKQVTRYDATLTSSSYDTLYFEIRFSVKEAGIYMYRFELDVPEGIAFCGKGEDLWAIRGDFLPEYQLTVYQKGFVTPDFLKGGLIYHIFVDRFCRSGDTPFRKRGTLKQWHESLTLVDEDGVYRANDFYGGNFRGIIDKLPYLSSLGVTCLYLSPIFKSASNHRYDTGDYMKIDELIGDDDTFAELISKALGYGIRIILDGVFNHTGADSIYFNKFHHYPSLGAYESKDSPYYEMYDFYDYPDLYNCWWGVTVCPTTNKSSEVYRSMLLGKGGILEHWLSRGIGGYRLDVVDELPIDIVDSLRKVVKAENSDSVIIGEVWEDASTKVAYGERRPYLLGGQLDGVMNYPFKEAILDYCMGGKVGSFVASVGEIYNNYPKQCLDVCMTLVDSHDTVRILNVLTGVDVSGKTKEELSRYEFQPYMLELAKHRLRLAVAIQYTLVGVPTVYYGDEVGLMGFADPLNRQPFPWDNMDTDILDMYRNFGRLRANYKEVFSGDMRVYELNGLLAVERSGSGKKIVAVCNNTESSIYFANGFKLNDIFAGERVDGSLILPNYAKIFEILC